MRIAMPNMIPPTISMPVVDTVFADLIFVFRKSFFSEKKTMRSYEVVADRFCRLNSRDRIKFVFDEFYEILKIH